MNRLPRPVLEIAASWQVFRLLSRVPPAATPSKRRLNGFSATPGIWFVSSWMPADPLASSDGTKVNAEPDHRSNCTGFRAATRVPYGSVTNGAFGWTDLMMLLVVSLALWLATEILFRHRK